MYDSSGAFTLGFVTCGLLLTTVIFFLGKSEGERIYRDCRDTGIYIYHDDRILKCEAK